MRARAITATLLLTAACSAGDERTASSTTAAIDPDTAAMVTAVLDGDSLRVDPGDVEVRLLGINAPERGECWSDDAAQVLSGLVGDAVSIEAHGNDQFGRTLAYVRSPSGLVNLELVRAGAAIALDGEHPKADDFLAAEERAWQEGAGLWGADACGPASGAGLDILRIDPDPRGPDEDSLDEEVVVLVNRGEPVDLGGWTLRDESSAHRFRFPDGLTLREGETLTVASGCGGTPPGTISWCAGGPVWNNDGDMAMVLDAFGNVVARLRY